MKNLKVDPKHMLGLRPADHGGSYRVVSLTGPESTEVQSVLSFGPCKCWAVREVLRLERQGYKNLDIQREVNNWHDSSRHRPKAANWRFVTYVLDPSRYRDCRCSMRANSA